MTPQAAEVRHISDDGLDLIKKFEGLALKKYKDIAGIDTIGYGHVMKKGETFPNGVTEEVATALLKKDVATAESYVTKYVTVPLTQHEFDALTSFVYNCGGGNFASSTLLKKLNKGDYLGAADEFLKWIHAGGAVAGGLIRRRGAERHLFLQN